MKISVVAEKCTGCRICELACSHIKLQSYDPKNACIKVVNLDYWGFSNPVVCIQCKKPACVEVCPTRALSQRESGTIQVDAGKCNGCSICVDECPIGAINWHEERELPMICDLCGGKPTCVEWCSNEALTFNNSRAKGIKTKGKKELRYSVAKGKRSLSKLKIPENVFDWYEKFI